VGGFKHFYFSIIYGMSSWDVILPIDELHHFSRWLLHHQPDKQASKSATKETKKSALMEETVHTAQAALHRS
jgi:hypothetical protein